MFRKVHYTIMFPVAINGSGVVVHQVSVEKFLVFFKEIIYGKQSEDARTRH